VAAVNRRALPAALVLCVSAVGVCVSQETEAASVPSAVFERIGNDALATKKAPGFSFAVVRDGKLAYAGAFGQADVERNVPVAVETRFAIGSLTKQFTAASLLLLAERRQVALDDSLAKYVPAFPNAAAITLRMLLNQTSGLHNYPSLGEHPWPVTGASTAASLVPFFAADKPDFAPGTRYEYSNTNYALLAVVIDKASGLDEAAFLQRNVFEPLKMTASGFGLAAQNVPGLATPYSGRADFEPQSPLSLDLFSGAGAIVSDAPDLALWDVALMHGTLLDSRSMQALWTAGTLASGEPTRYAMGFVPAVLAGHREVWHNGLSPGAGGYCYNAIFPDDGLAVIVLSNGYSFEGEPERIVARTLAAYDPRAAADGNAAPASPAPGEDPAVTARAKDWWHRLQTGSVDMSLVDARFAQLLTPDLLASIEASLAERGAPTDWIYLGSQNVTGAVIYKYRIRLDGAEHVWSIGLTPDGKISGSLLQ
jgi:D-alanyl-D-alanine carboxypeptidase